MSTLPSITFTTVTTSGSAAISVASNSTWVGTKTYISGTTQAATNQYSDQLAYLSALDDSAYISYQNYKQGYQHGLSVGLASAKPPPPKLNRYLNSSDLLEEFFDYLATQGVTKRSIDEIPVKLYILWLCIRAAEADKEAIDPELTIAVEAGIRQLALGTPCVPPKNQLSAKQPEPLLGALFLWAFFSAPPPLKKVKHPPWRRVLV